MNVNSYKATKKFMPAGLVFGALLCSAGLSQAAEYWMWAGQTSISVPGSATPITMWGYYLDDDANLSNGCTAPTGCVPTIPGPRLTIPPGDSNLIVHLGNALPMTRGANTPVSMVIPGQMNAAAPAPVILAGRVRSFNVESMPGAPATYIWGSTANPLKAGSYLYHSGTHIQVQVQMGLAGAMVRDVATGMAYSGLAYDSEVMQFYNEIDPALHAAVAADCYGAAPAGDTCDGVNLPARMTSTILYRPRFFLVNGKPFEIGDAPTAAGNVGDRILLRFFNAGIKTHMPSLYGAYMSIVAEDGKPYPYAHTQYAMDLQALKTKDAFLSSTLETTLPLFDRRLNLTNGANAGGGLQSYLMIGAAPTPTLPAVPSGVVATGVDAAVIVNWDLVAGATGYIVYESTTATVIPTSAPPATHAGLSNGTTYSYVVSATNTVGEGASSTPAVSAMPSLAAPLPPVVAAVAGAGQVTLSWTGGTGAVSFNLNYNTTGGVTATDNPVINVSTAYTVTGLSNGTTYFFMVTAVNTAGATTSVEVSATPAGAVVAPTANRDSVATPMNTAIDIDVLANDVAGSGTLDPATIRIESPSRRGGTLSIDTLSGVMTYMPPAGVRGTDNLSYSVANSGGVRSNTATVRISITR